MRTPNLNSLKMFDAAARHLNFRLAGDELNLSQGAVAQQVRRIESDLGLKLFLRKARGLALTEIGKDYHLSIRRALAIIEDATHKLRPENTRITLSVTPSFASKWLVPKLSSFAAFNPDVDIQTIASEGLANFRSDGVDIAIRLGEPSTVEGFQIEWLAPLDLYAACSPEYAREIGPITQIENLAALELIQDSHYHWDGLFYDIGLKSKNRILQFNQTSLAMDAAVNSQGIVLAPRLLLNTELEQGKLVNIWQDIRPTQVGFYLIYPILQKSNFAREAMIDWLLSETKVWRGEHS